MSEIKYMILFWAADPDYKHISRKVTGGPDIHVIYNYKADDSKNDSAWMKIADAAVTVLPFIEKNFGKISLPAILVHTWRRWRHGICHGHFDQRAFTRNRFS